ncbi:MAG: type III pantothenate kinase [Bacteroidales bacterium]|nr:type III pantothenate kinase [Bacteroidales bacterium]
MDFLIDIGNTSCKVARLSSSGEISGVDHYQQMASVLEAIPEGVDKIVLSNVRADDEEFYKGLRSKCKKLIIISVDYTNDLLRRRSDVRILDVLEKMPEGMGADRIAAILAAHSRFPDRNLIVFDFGTAITVEFINRATKRRKAEYKGGSISLGLMTRYRAIQHFAARIDLRDPSKYIGRPISCYANNLDDALAAGNILGIKFEIEGYMSANRRRTVVLTGGDAVYFTDRLKGKAVYLKDLVLEGLALIAKYDE